jgi:hypothetical protein
MYINTFEDNILPEQIQDEYKEAIDIFPALHKYKIAHTIPNLQKLCVEISEFCRAVYASTQNAEERQVYREFIEKLNK